MGKAHVKLIALVSKLSYIIHFCICLVMKAALLLIDLAAAIDTCVIANVIVGTGDIVIVAAGGDNNFCFICDN